MKYAAWLSIHRHLEIVMYHRLLLERYRQPSSIVGRRHIVSGNGPQGLFDADDFTQKE